MEFITLANNGAAFGTFTNCKLENWTIFFSGP